jgi:hypothetical protein
MSFDIVFSYLQHFGYKQDMSELLQMLIYCRRCDGEDKIAKKKRD